ncbi:MAG: tol-pal system-associated acyl-CoA thioesterase [Chromatiales bacterium]|jgi:acyl-CoA thioester hydrolase|nr:tol-pal system-associated acyl-CoA thioesterase [Chromatiales bacterium]
MFHWTVRVYYEDTDSGGVVYYANYLKFMERARTEWLRNLGYEQDVLSTQYGIVFAVRSVAIDYLRPARFNDLLHVSARLDTHRAAELCFAQTVTRARGKDETPGSGEVLCSAEVKVVCVDSSSFRPRRIPEKLLAETLSEP